MIGRRVFLALSLAMLAGACHGTGGSGMPGDSDDHTPFGAIAESEAVRFTGTEPFWGGEVADGRLTYTTPDNPQGTIVPVSRFAGRGGLSFSGELAGQSLTLAVTPGDCSDGMSDRTYPFVATLRLGEDLRQGCAWTERQPRTEGGRSPVG
ncbi:COG3650 family protein [Novosphingobium mangrovi (ex Huang et al. 2023)]|uniref:Uncharacterized protein n=1 Tax=Novosphingobium mangrovi (ex Huang et al. 2023) TaxID=2976432 RepID=A0ABT2HZQ6_9SPHN|nr:hypothetical protein [Novosphingobium mangrovi (ex Huang et al. 2023)]MCT2398035.1 hypothetical protein [Novosphingobium mangrovi (ex Huang et al. 2023)]